MIPPETTLFTEYASFLKARQRMEPQHTTQWLRLNHTFVSICQQQMSLILAEESECISIHVLDIEQSELVRVERQERWEPNNDKLLYWLRENKSVTTSTGPLEIPIATETIQVEHHGEGLGRYTVVGTTAQHHYLIEVPIFNLPLTIDLIWTKKQPVSNAKKTARQAVTRICEKYLSTLLNIPLIQKYAKVKATY